MTQEALRDVEELRAFEATRRFEELSFFHVPFDELNGDYQTERALTKMIASEGRVAVIGASGAGKSSLISAVLGPLALDLPEHIVPLRVPVATEDDDTVTDPGAMARHLVRYVTRWASPTRFSDAEHAEFERGVADVSRRSRGGKTRDFRIALPLWFANAEFSRQVQSVGEEYEAGASGADAMEYLKRLTALFASHNLFPIFVFDDSDTWLRIEGLDRTAVANEFFMRSVRMMTKELDAGMVVAIHDHYLELAGYQEAVQWLSGEIRVPRLLDSRAGLEAILRDRLEMAEVGAPIEDVIEMDAMDYLAKYYDSEKTIRDVLRVAQRSLQHALSSGLDVVTVPQVEQTIAELAPTS